MLRVTLAFAIFTCVSGSSHATEGPPPDPRAHERSDGRLSDDPRYDELLMVPRILLSPLRVASYLASQPLQGLLILQDRYQVLSRLNHLITSIDGKRGLRPDLRYISRREPQMGITYFDHRLLGPGSSVFLTVGAVLPALIYAEGSVHPRTRGRVSFALDASFFQRKDFLFAGVGLTSQGGLRANDAPLSRYSDRIWHVGLGADMRLTKKLYLKLGERWALHKYGNGQLSNDEQPIVNVYCTDQVGPMCLHPNVDPAKVPGFYTGANFFTTDAALVYDVRIGNHDSGFWYRLELGARYAQTPSQNGARWIVGRGAADIGFPLGSQTRALDLRLAVELLEPLGGAPVPFTELVMLGGPNDLRGAPIGRFHDYSSVLATIAYRWQVWMWMDAELFNDWGGVFGKHLLGFRPDRLVPDIGGGVRLHSANRFILRAQVAYGFSDGWQFMFSTTTPL